MKVEQAIVVTQEVLSDLARAKAVFQLRTIAAIIRGEQKGTRHAY